MIHAHCWQRHRAHCPPQAVTAADGAMAADAARTLSERCVVCWRELCLYAQRFACPECNAMIHARCAAEHARWHQQQQQQQDPDATDHSMHEFLAADDAHGVEDADEGGVLYRPASAHRPASGSLDTMANPARPGAGSANAPGTASARDLEQYTTHMLPSRPQMPPPIELRIEKILRQHTSQADSACRRHSSVIGLAPSLDELDEPGSASSPRHDSESKGTANSWQHDSKSEIRAWDVDERQEERQSEQKDNRHWASGPFDGPGSTSSQGQDSESKVCSDGSDDRKASLQESMRKWAEQASMREDKALDIARKSKAKRQREGGDTHRAWLDQKYLKRTLKRLRQQSSSTAPAPGTASARAASEQPSTLCQTRASNTHPGSARLESKGAASARSFNKDV